MGSSPGFSGHARREPMQSPPPMPATAPPAACSDISDRRPASTHEQWAHRTRGDPRCSRDVLPWHRPPTARTRSRVLPRRCDGRPRHRAHALSTSSSTGVSPCSRATTRPSTSSVNRPSSSARTTRWSSRPTASRRIAPAGGPDHRNLVTGFRYLDRFTGTVGLAHQPSRRRDRLVAGRPRGRLVGSPAGDAAGAGGT